MASITTCSNKLYNPSDDCLDRTASTLNYAGCSPDKAPAADVALDHPPQATTLWAGGALSRAPVSEANATLSDEELDRPIETVSMCCCLCAGVESSPAPVSEATAILSDEVLDRPSEIVSQCSCFTEFMCLSRAAEVPVQDEDLNAPPIDSVSKVSQPQISVALMDEALDRPDEPHAFCEGHLCGLCWGSVHSAHHDATALDDEALDRPEGEIVPWSCSGAPVKMAAEERVALRDEQLDRPNAAASLTVTRGPSSENKRVPAQVALIAVNGPETAGSGLKPAAGKDVGPLNQLRRARGLRVVDRSSPSGCPPQPHGKRVCLSDCQDRLAA